MGDISNAAGGLKVNVNNAVVLASLQDNLAIDFGSGSCTYNSDHSRSDLTGHVTGSSNNMEFAGGFSVSDDSANDAYGVFVMEDTNN